MVIVIYCKDMQQNVVSPIKWPNAQSHSWILQQCEVFAAKLDTVRAFERYMTTADPKSWQQAGTLMNFTKFAWKPEVQEILNGKTKKYQEDGPYGWKRLTKGIEGSILPDKKELWQKLMDPNAIVQILRNDGFSEQPLQLPSRI